MPKKKFGQRHFGSQAQKKIHFRRSARDRSLIKQKRQETQKQNDIIIVTKFQPESNETRNKHCFLVGRVQHSTSNKKKEDLLS